MLPQLPTSSSRGSLSHSSSFSSSPKNVAGCGGGGIVELSRTRINRPSSVLPTRSSSSSSCFQPPPLLLAPLPQQQVSLPGIPGAVPTPLMFTTIMRLLQPRCAGNLRATCREAAHGFREYALENDDRVFLSVRLDDDDASINDDIDLSLLEGPLQGKKLIATAAAITTNSNRSGIAVGQQLAPLQRVVHHADVGRMKSSRSLTSSQNTAASSTSSLPSTVKRRNLTVTLDVCDGLSKHGATLQHNVHTGALRYEVSCAPLPTCLQLLRVSELFSQLPHSPTAQWCMPQEADGPHVCGPSPSSPTSPIIRGSISSSARHSSNPVPVCVLLSAPKFPPDLFSGTHLTIVVTSGTSRMTGTVQYGGGGRLHSLSSTPSSSQRVVSRRISFNTLPTGLLDVHMSSHAIEMRRLRLQSHTTPTPPTPSLVYTDVDPIIQSHLDTHSPRVTMSPPALAAAYLSMAERERCGAYTQRFDVPEGMMCPNCADLPIPIVWSISPRYLAHPNAGANFSENVSRKDDSRIIQEAQHKYNIVLDMSDLVNVVEIEEYFLAGAMISVVRLPRVISRDVHARRNAADDGDEEGGVDGSTSGGGGGGGFHVRTGVSKPTALTWSPKAYFKIIDDNLKDMTIQRGMVSMPLDPILAATTECIVSPGVSSSFLEDCKYLKEVDLGPLDGITRIGVSFMKNCISIKSLNVAPLRYINRLSPQFLSGCTSLKSLDLRPMVLIRLFPDEFLLDCSSLKEVHFPSNDTTVDFHTKKRDRVVIEGRFMCGCRSVETVDLTPMKGKIVFAKIWSSTLLLFDGCVSLRRLECNSSSSRSKAIRSMPADVAKQLGGDELENCRLM